MSLHYHIILKYRVPGFIDTADAPLLKPLIDAYDYGDDEKFQSILNNAHMKSHENEVQYT